MSEKTAKEERREGRAADTIYCPTCTKDGMPPGMVTQVAPNSPAFGCLDCGTVFIPEQVRRAIKVQAQQRIIVPRPVVPKVGGLIKAVK